MEELAESFRKASLLSISSKVEKTEIQKNKSLPPPDKFYILHILFLIFGITSLLPMTFFLTSNQYWMYKFRDPDDEDRRTVLQANFAPVTIAAQTIPSIVVTYFALKYGHKWSLRSRVIFALSIIICCFLTSTIFIVVNTDGWQTGFFILTTIMLILINSISAILHLAIMVLTSKFPQDFVKFYTLGHGMTGLFSAVLQIISITIGKNVTQNALIYFCSGTSLLIVATGLFYYSKNLILYKYYIDAAPEDTQRAPHTWAELKPVMVKTLPTLVQIVTLMPTIFMFHPNLSVLVKSEYYSDGSAWSTKYFVPVLTFLLSDIVSLIGRITATPIVTAKNGWIFIIVCILRSVLLSPLVIFCNIDTPNRHLPVIFNHDWEFALIIAILAFVNGYLLTSSYISIPNLAGDDLEKAYPLLQVAVTLASVTSPLGVLVVNLI